MKAIGESGDFRVDSFKSMFQGGARGYLFYMKPQFPAGLQTISDREVIYMVRSTSLPTESIEELLVNWQGYDFKFGGKHTFADWTVTFNMDKDGKVHQSFHNWQQKVHNSKSNEYGLPVDYMTTQTVQLLNHLGQPIVEYKLFDAWPGEVAEVTLDYGSNEVAQFAVTFKYVRHEISYA